MYKYTQMVIKEIIHIVDKKFSLEICLKIL